MFTENVEVMNFAQNPDECLNFINGFIEEATQNNIKNLLPPGSIGTDTKMVLANAAFFKGQWASKFDKEDTKKEIFYDHGRNTVFVDMMKQTGHFNYGVSEQLGAHWLEMPYKGDKGISMFIFLPVFTPTAIDELLVKITPEILDEVFAGGLQREVEVEFPKLSFERKFELVPVNIYVR